MYKLYIHSGSDNHGCEAIVRTTVSIINEPVTLFSRKPEIDEKYGISEICDVIFDEKIITKKWTLSGIISVLQIKVFGKIDFLIKRQYRRLLRDINSKDICFSIGGDNYCYPGTDVLAAINNGIKKKGAKLVLWGCSVEPSILEQPDIAKDLASFDLITVRESISYNALKRINANTIQVSDPAFLLEKKILPLPQGWDSGNMIGINASPLILKSGKSEKLVYEAYENLIEEILRNTEFSVALIPHVVCKDNDDRIVLNCLYNKFKETKRIVLIEDCNCMELKGYISQCRMFIGARTHATIAAYSSNVPTLVLGYSVKSVGIATDLFGTAEKYVLPVQALERPEELANHFKWIMEHEEEIKRQLEAIMPSYIAKAYLGKSAIERLEQS